VELYLKQKVFRRARAFQGTECVPNHFVDTHSGEALLILGDVLRQQIHECLDPEDFTICQRPKLRVLSQLHACLYPHKRVLDFMRDPRCVKPHLCKLLQLLQTLTKLFGELDLLAIKGIRYPKEGRVAFNLNASSVLCLQRSVITMFSRMAAMKNERNAHLTS